MAKKQMLFKTKGMNRDLSVSAFNPEFAFENINLRLSTNEGNTLLSWVNEKGTLQITDNESTPAPISLSGTPIGTAVIDHKLVVFTTENNVEKKEERAQGKNDFIYVLEYADDEKTKMNVTELYSGNLNFYSGTPLETLVSYEAEHIQKVYWTDGRNQPRLINIKGDIKAGVDTQFDFVPSMELKEEVTITKKTSGGGMFAPGVIQYAFTYINKYRQQTNIFYISPLYYISHYDRGGSPEEKIANNFIIKIQDADKKYDYIRLYAIQRTSLDAVPFVRLLDDIPTTGTTASELYTRTVVYSEENVSTLPSDDIGRILTVTTKRGTYTTSIVPLDADYAFDNNANVDVIAYSSTIVDGVEHIQEETIMAFKDLVDLVFEHGSVYRNLVDIEDYYAAFTIEQDIDQMLDGRAVSLGQDRWALKSGSDILLGDGASQFYKCKFVYNYKDQKWYVTKSSINVTVTKDEIIGGNFITYVDNGLHGTSMDPTELLFVGGKDITALTMADKDQTMFMGNIRQKDTLVDDVQTYIDEKKPVISFHVDDTKKVDLKTTSGVYVNTNQLNMSLRQIAGFKGGETYRMGFQLQKATGEWLDPIFIDDVTNELYPVCSMNSVQLPYASASLDLSTAVDTNIIKRIRPVVVFPTIGDENVICQGVLNPTVFNSLDRIDKVPYAQSSWYFRPYLPNISDSVTTINLTNKTEVIPPVPQPADPDLSLDSFFVEHGDFCKPVYVMVADVDDANTLKNIRSRGYISATYWEVYLPKNPTQDNDAKNIFNQDYRCEIFGIIDLGNNRYAFVSDKESWKTVHNSERSTAYYTDVDAEMGDAFYFNDSIKNPKTEDGVAFTACSLDKTIDYQLFYRKPESTSAPNLSAFKFYAGGEYYVVNFGAVEGLATTDNKSGNAVRFCHYDSLYSNDDLPTKEKDNDPAPDLTDQYGKEEIQGAVKVYETPFAQSKKFIGEANTQFFIDQSILTMHSPEIEFDTNVQTYDFDGTKLRIIGAVPITAYASSHHIKTSSSMLETGHNKNKGDSTPVFGAGELNTNVTHNNLDINACKRLVAEYLWNDVVVNSDASQEDKITTGDRYNFMIYPWHKSGSLNNDTRAVEEASSVLGTKKESGLLYSPLTEYFAYNGGDGADNFSNISSQILLSENAEIINARLPKQKSSSSEINYYPNIDKVLYNANGSVLPATSKFLSYSPRTVSGAVSMKYKSTTHAVVALNAYSSSDIISPIPILPYGEMGSFTTGKYENSSGTEKTFWGDEHMAFRQNPIKLPSSGISGNYGFLWLGELYRNPDSNTKFGGKSKEALHNNKWLIAGEAVDITDDPTNINIKWTDGDTFMQRYDCLKTFAYTDKDPNQIVEILSFMCETHINIDGRYDKNRSQVDNTNMSPQNFNLINDAYSQKSNFFTSRKIASEKLSDLKYPNHITFSKTKTSGADVDLWTNVTLASILEMDGDKGDITSLQRLNNQLICFQDTGISHILYNDNVQIASSTGVPIEIANSGKVQGKDYKSSTIGCSNKWSIVNTPSGIYFMDSNDKSIYLFNGQLQNISQSGGFNTWCKQNIPSSELVWNPKDFGNFVGYYDKLNQDVLWINSMKDADGNETGKALAFSEKLGAFTSFYDYGGSPYFCNLDDTGVWIRKNGDLKNSDLWKHQAGDYCKFFGVNKPYSMTLVGNPEPQMDKIFTNLEFRACVEDDYTTKTVTEGGVEKTVFDKFLLPFDSLETWNEYQHGIAELKNLNGHDLFKHHRQDSNEASLKRKFRIWRCDIPRDNAQVVLPQIPTPEEQKAYDDFITDEHVKGIYRMKAHPVDRMRNPWLYLKLLRNAEQDATKSLGKAEIHDIVMTYFG